jgi:hypothetical protein
MRSDNSHFCSKRDGGLTQQQLKGSLGAIVGSQHESQFPTGVTRSRKRACHLWLPFLVLKRDENAWTVLLVSNAPAVTSGASSVMVIVEWLSS